MNKNKFFFNINPLNILCSMAMKTEQAAIRDKFDFH